DPASVPIHDLSMLAAVRATPPVTTLGNVTPTGPVQPACSTICATVVATASGVDGCGVRILIRSPTRRPESRSTTAPLTPLPPMSTPNPWLAGVDRSVGTSCAIAYFLSLGGAGCSARVETIMPGVAGCGVGG